jgi:nucleoside-diphosphate-sugar epimerase
MKKRAIITGITGFIGTWLSAELEKQGVETVGLYMRSDPNTARLPDSVWLTECGMDEYPLLPNRLNVTDIDVFYHLAWEGASGPQRADAALQALNVKRTLEALEAAHKIGCRKFIAAGTVYENFHLQMVESERWSKAEFTDGNRKPATPRNAAFYIIAKRFARDMAKQLAWKLGIELVWCTFCHPVGRYMKPEQLFAYTVKHLLEGTPPEYGMANDYFDVIDAEDLAYALYLAGNKPLKNSEYFIGSGHPQPLRAYLQKVPEILGVNTPVKIGVKPDDGMRFMPEWFDGSEFANETGFLPRYGFEEIILRLKDALR